MSTSATNPSGASPAVLITGYRGLARKFIKTFHAAGEPVSVLVRRDDAVKELETAFPGIHLHVGDQSDKAVCRDWIDGAIEKFGSIGCLVNNAAVMGPGAKMGDLDFEAFEKALDIDLISPLYLCHVALKKMKSPGVFLNLSGGGATAARPYFSAYAAAKSAIVRITEGLAEEYAGHRFYAISPGAMATSMMQQIAEMPEGQIGGESASAKEHMAKQSGDPQLAADLALYLYRERPIALNGCVISAVWDNYKNPPDYTKNVGWWKLRRVDEVCQKNLKS